MAALVKLGDSGNPASEPFMDALVEYLKQHVPLTCHIDIQAGQQADDWFELSAPLTPNLNDKQTAFGGTLAALCTLCGWCAVSSLCRDRQLEVDIAVLESRIRYRLPVTSDPITARASLPDKQTQALFLEKLIADGAARLEIDAQISMAAKTAVSFSGIYHARLLD